MEGTKPVFSCLACTTCLPAVKAVCVGLQEVCGVDAQANMPTDTISAKVNDHAPC